MKLKVIILLNLLFFIFPETIQEKNTSKVKTNEAKPRISLKDVSNVCKPAPVPEGRKPEVPRQKVPLKDGAGGKHRESGPALQEGDKSEKSKPENCAKSMRGTDDDKTDKFGSVCHKGNESYMVEPKKPLTEPEENKSTEHPSVPEGKDSQTLVSTDQTSQPADPTTDSEVQKQFEDLLIDGAEPKLTGICEECLIDRHAAEEGECETNEESVEYGKLPDDLDLDLKGMIKVALKDLERELLVSKHKVPVKDQRTAFIDRATEDDEESDDEEDDFFDIDDEEEEEHVDEEHGEEEEEDGCCCSREMKLHQ